MDMFTPPLLLETVVSVVEELAVPKLCICCGGGSACDTVRRRNIRRKFRNGWKRRRFCVSVNKSN